MASQPILIVDDDPAILDLIAQLLTDEGYSILTANGGQAGIDLATKYLPKLILLDLMMPEMNGWQVVTLLKSAARTRFIPILLLSARRDMNITAQELGVSDYLAKPFDLDELLRYVEKILKRSNSAPSPH
jgi:two-component system alkaline phosphatase synthesis response regulator PhoP